MVARPPKYQLTLGFAPNNSNTDFIPCFSGKMEEWLSDFNKEQQHTGNMGLLYMAIFIIVAAVICGGSFFLYQKHQNHRSARGQWKQSLLGGSQPSAGSSTTSSDTHDLAVQPQMTF